MTQQLIVVSDENELERAVMQQALVGFAVKAQSSRRAVLHRKKRFSLATSLIYLLLSLFLGLIVLWAIGFAVYVIVYARRDDDFIEVLIEDPEDQDEPSEGLEES